MASGFHTGELLKSTSNYPVAKGDVMGHAFHGNQYQTGTSLGTVPTGIHTINGKDVTIAPGANLTNANLRGANLYWANLHNANLSGAKLNNANLYQASLGYAKLTNANLQDANLSNANLLNANLYGANLSNADLTGAYLKGATANENTKLPDTHEVVNGFVVEK
jgi:uncharacterized protein YjbI with pentapeptide repeats